MCRVHDSLRRELIIDRAELTYPEGVACAEVIKNTSDSGNGSSWYIVKGVVLGGLVNFTGGLRLLLGSVETADLQEESFMWASIPRSRFWELVISLVLRWRFLFSLEGLFHGVLRFHL